ncbi:MAG: septation protein A [Hyphomicrobiales bacterium]
MSETDKKSNNFLLEIFPLAAFFLGYKFAHVVFKNDPEDNLIYATGILMAATIIALAIRWVKERKIAVMPLVTLVIVLIFGGLTIYFDSKLFIKIKPTILNLSFASILLGGLLFKKSFISIIMGPVLNLQPRGWFILTLMWGIFFIFLAGLNEYVWRNYIEETWVSFKVFGVLPITLTFSMVSIFAVSKHLIQDEDEPKKLEK